MERWDHKSQRELARQIKHRRENPSFSSSLLDSIYRSIDEGEQIGARREGELIFYKETMRKKQSTTVSSKGVKAEEEIMSLQRACLIEKWMEKKAAASEKVMVRRNSTADFDRRFLNSSSSSSDSSCGGGFSSSESDSIYRSRSRSTSSCYSMPRPKPIRTSLSSTRPETHQKPKQENGFVKTKSKALKIYGDLKKVKQPMSPGGKLASFLNSIFNGGNGKKHKINIDDLGSDRNSKSTNESNCSSASSFSRSCLRKTSVSRGEHSNGGGDSAKRSVRFYPVSVIVDEDCRPCGHKTLEEMKRSSALDCYVMDEEDHRRQVEQVARSYLMKNYVQKKTHHDEGMEEDEDDDAASYASSDLFELDTVGVEERYREELPVYETTYLDRNRAIANGLIL
ncbi:protein BIG GRAIN 1-like A [Argentina anserina]|uniref:protein BIG GRAIN 1-like A n=1 Tax=Argentina anserina TaxID=57926 RepID=UPI00217670BD|nr:protein BIG GRAIN 1-like A [Potentilla anserina]